MKLTFNRAELYFGGAKSYCIMNCEASPFQDLDTEDLTPALEVAFKSMAKAGNFYPKEARLRYSKKLNYAHLVGNGFSVYWGEIEGLDAQAYNSAPDAKAKNKLISDWLDYTKKNTAILTVTYSEDGVINLSGELKNEHLGTSLHGH